MAMTRQDRYIEGFNPDRHNARHIENVLNPDVHQVALAGNHQDVDIIVTALRVYAAEAAKQEAMGRPVNHFARRIEEVLAAVAIPQFAEQPQADSLSPTQV